MSQITDQPTQSQDSSATPERPTAQPHSDIRVAEASARYLAETAGTATPACPPGYKLTEVGVIPEDWLVYSLSSICDVRDGTHDSPKYKDNGVPLVTSKNIVDDVLDLGNVCLISPEEALEIDKRSKVNRGDIIMSMIGTVGSAVLLVDEPNFCIKNVALIKPKRVLGEYLIHLIRSRTFQSYLEDSMDGGIQKFISLGTLRNMKVSLPYEKEQTAIANALSDMDALIGGLEKLIAKKQAIKTATMQQLLTGRTRLPQFALREDGTHTNSSGTNLDAGTGGPKGEGQDGLRKGYKQSELGEIPEDWEVVQISELGQVDPENLGVMTMPSYEFDYISLEQVERGVLTGTTRTTLKEAPSRARRIVKKGDVLVSTVRPNLMSHYFVEHDAKDLICSTGFSVIRFYEGKLCPQYLYQHLFASVVNKQIETLISGSNYPAINSTDVRQLKIQVGCLEEQTAIATILSDMDEEIQTLQQRLEKTRQIKQGMMQELLTGRTRLVKPEQEVA